VSWTDCGSIARAVPLPKRAEIASAILKDVVTSGSRSTRFTLESLIAAAVDGCSSIVAPPGTRPTVA
jgi:hypothetical protein